MKEQGKLQILNKTFPILNTYNQNYIIAVVNALKFTQDVPKKASPPPEDGIGSRAP